MIRQSLVLAIMTATLVVSACNSGSRQEQHATQQQISDTAVNLFEDPASMTADNGAELDPSTKAVNTSSGKVIQMTTAEFKKKIFNYDKNPDEWIFEGERPCIVDFYADWCRPCKLVAPIMDELAIKYAGQIDIYKVNTDQERELSQVFGIRSIPSMLFCPAEGKPQMTSGALPKETYEEVIQNFLLNTGAVKVN